ncbi:peroxisomal membrane protein PEX13-like [Ostrinia nubilalis]|uniref:peroxisomal membrane protein PEX13-like n=1 Tax=Ostrinia nubilalis TaxID=29057 RepID=UPI0030822467
MLALLLLLGICMGSIESAVLDPSLYLLPSPPLSGKVPTWSQPSRVTREAATHDPITDSKTTTTEESESMESSETFWSSMRTSGYGLGGIHIPLTFSVSGTYGSDGYGSGVVGSGYGSGVVGSGYGSGVVGSGYGSGVVGGYGTGLLGYGASVAGTYASVSSDEPAKFSNYGKSALAGSSYGTYGSGYPGVRLFSGNSKPGWSGWGNGKWGHYGKG